MGKNGGGALHSESNEGRIQDWGEVKGKEKVGEEEEEEGMHSPC